MEWKLRYGVDIFGAIWAECKIGTVETGEEGEFGLASGAWGSFKMIERDRWGIGTTMRGVVKAVSTEKGRAAGG